MIVIRKKVLRFAYVVGLGTIVLMCLLAFATIKHYIREYMVYLCFFAPATGFSILVLLQKYKQLKTAEVITENQIIHIPSAYPLYTNQAEVISSSPQKTDIVISNFGILLNSKMIEFNPGGVQLIAVEMGQDFISITYGKDEHAQTIRLMHEKLDHEALVGIAEKFCFETGVVPKMIM